MNTEERAEECNASESGEERVTHTVESRRTWRQIGFWCQTGAFYSLAEDPSLYDWIQSADRSA